MSASSCGIRLFHRQEPSLSVETARVTRQASVCADDSVAWYNQRNGIMTDRAADSLGRHVRAACLRRDFVRDFAIGYGLSEGNRKKDFPYGFPEGRRIHGNRRREIGRFSAEINVQPVYGLVKDRAPALNGGFGQGASIIFLAVEP